MSLVLEREALSNQIADDLATRNANAGLIEGAVNAKAESLDVTNALALKAPLASPQFTGTPKLTYPAKLNLGTMGFVQDRRISNSDDVGNSRTVILHGCYVSDNATNTYTRLSAYDCYKIEFGGTSEIAMYKVDGGTGTFTDADWVLISTPYTPAEKALLATLNADDTTEGSVAKSIKDAVDPTKGTGWTDENLVGLQNTKVKLTKMPDGATAVYSQDAWATVDGWSFSNSTNVLSDGTITITPTNTAASMYYNSTAFVGKTFLVRCKRNVESPSLVQLGYWDGVAASFIPLASYIVSTEYTILKATVPLNAQRMYVALVGSTFTPLVIDAIWIGDYSYLENSLATEASRIANQLGDTAGVGTKASGTITSNGTSVSDGDTVTIAGKTYTFKTTLTPAEGEVIIGADFGASMIRLYWAVNRASPETHDGVNYKIAVAHPLVTASTVSPYSIITLTAKKSGILGNSITLAKSASTLTLSGSTLTGGTDDVRGKMITQLESAHGGVPKFNGVSFPDTQVPSSDPNTLDDYEEGTWTPVLTRYTTPSEHTYTKQEGRYLKIGNKVTIWFVVQTSALITAGDGQNNITGLPFVPASGISFYGSGDVVYCSLVSALAGIVALPGKSYLHFVSTEISTGTIADGWNASGYMVGSITYTV